MNLDHLDAETTTTTQLDPSSKHPQSKSTEIHTSKATPISSLLKKKEEPAFLKARIISSSSIMLKSASTPMTQKSTTASARVSKVTKNGQVALTKGPIAVIVKGGQQRNTMSGRQLGGVAAKVGDNVAKEYF